MKQAQREHQRRQQTRAQRERHAAKPPAPLLFVGVDIGRGSDPSTWVALDMQSRTFVARGGFRGGKYAAFLESLKQAHVKYDDIHHITYEGGRGFGSDVPPVYRSPNVIPSIAAFDYVVRGMTNANPFADVTDGIIKARVAALTPEPEGPLDIRGGKVIDRTGRVVGRP